MVEVSFISLSQMRSQQKINTSKAKRSYWILARYYGLTMACFAFQERVSNRQVLERGVKPPLATVWDFLASVQKDRKKKIETGVTKKNYRKEYFLLSDLTYFSWVTYHLKLSWVLGKSGLFLETVEAVVALTKFQTRRKANSHSSRRPSGDSLL